jgi:hypothetical protein
MQKLTLDKGQPAKGDAPKNEAAITREKIARRAALEFQVRRPHVSPRERIVPRRVCGRHDSQPVVW